MLIGSLRIEIEDENPKIMQSKINTIITQALKKAKAEKLVIASSEQHLIYQYYYPNSKKGEEKS